MASREIETLSLCHEVRTNQLGLGTDTLADQRGQPSAHVIGHMRNLPDAVAPSVTLSAKEAANLVRLLRRVGRQGGATIAKRGEFDARIAKFLFADAPVAARNATMRGLVSAGVDSQDLHKLDELSQYLAKAPGFDVDLRDHNAVSGSFRFQA